MRTSRRIKQIAFTLVLALLVLVALPAHVYNPCTILGTEESGSYVEMWVERGCGGHYRAGESIPISFKVTSPAPQALITIRGHKSGTVHYVVRHTSYSTNTVHAVTGIVFCPPGIDILEIIAIVPQNVYLFDTCHIYIDPPCTSADSDQDGYFVPDDCNDEDSSVYPGAEEYCDDKDNNCNGLVDEGCYSCLRDIDGDSIPQCNDCDDHDRNVYPQADEVCDGKDNDCDGLIDEGCCICYDDVDRDGYSDCWDCNDTDPTVYPGAYERCDGKDNDCDGFTDEGGRCDYAFITVDKGCGAYYDDKELITIDFGVHSSAQAATVTITHYPPQGTPRVWVSKTTVASDKDQRIYRYAQCPVGLNLLIITATVIVNGEPVTLVDDCGFYIVSCESNDVDDDGYESLLFKGADCDDNDVGVYPGAGEVCDGKDNDCDGYIDEGLDCNYAEIWIGGTENNCGGSFDDRAVVNIRFRVFSSAPTAFVTITDYPPQKPPSVLAADKMVYTNYVYDLTGIARCAGVQTLIISATVIVEGVPVTLTDECSFLVSNCKKNDSDGDGYDSVLVGGDDCDDENPEVNPGALEVCDDGKDNDCDGLIDRPDNDNDGYISDQCGGDDCDDSDRTVYPGAEEVYDRKDNNCNGSIDEGITADLIDEDQDGYSLSVDCNDRDSTVNPGAVEVCTDGKDNDCDGLIDCFDEGCASDEACKEKILGVDVDSIRDVIGKYWYIILGGLAGFFLIIVGWIIYSRRKMRIREEVGQAPAPEKEAEKKGFFKRFRREKKERKEEEKTEEEFTLEEEMARETRKPPEEKGEEEFVLEDEMAKEEEEEEEDLFGLEDVL